MTVRKHGRALYVMLDIETHERLRARANELRLSLREFVSRALDAYQSPRSVEARLEELELRMAKLEAAPRVR